MYVSLHLPIGATLAKFIVFSVFAAKLLLGASKFDSTRSSLGHNIRDAVYLVAVSSLQYAHFFLRQLQESRYRFLQISLHDLPRRIQWEVIQSELFQRRYTTKCRVSAKDLHDLCFDFILCFISEILDYCEGFLAEFGVWDRKDRRLRTLVVSGSVGLVNVPVI